MTSHEILTADAHREITIRTGHGADAGDTMMGVLTVPNEFRAVQNDYPILFQLNLEREGLAALALFGFEKGENLFIENGRWDALYRPLAIDIRPFLIGGAAGTGVKQIHIDMASPRICSNAAEDGERVFHADGSPTPYLQAIADKLGALDAGYQTSSEFFAALRRHELLEPLTVEITFNDGSSSRLVGFQVIDEDRLNALDASALGELHAEGHLMPIFMAIASLSNLPKLIERKNQRLMHG